MNRVLEPLREIGRALAVLLGVGDPGMVDEPAPAPRRGALFVLVQTVAAAVVATVLYGGKVLVVGDRAMAVALAFVVLIMAVPLAVNWLAEPARRGSALAAGLVAGVVVGIAVAGTVGLGTWGLFVSVLAGFVVAGAVFGAVSGP